MQGTTGHTNGANTATTTYSLPGGRVVTASEPPPTTESEVFSEETETKLREIAANQNRSPGLRAMASSLLAQLAAIREADAAEREADWRRSAS
jgi:hypothetical protein